MNILPQARRSTFHVSSTSALPNVARIFISSKQPEWLIDGALSGDGVGVSTLEGVAEISGTTTGDDTSLFSCRLEDWKELAW